MQEPNMPLVTVIIPFLNEDKFLGETVESVLRQDYKNWELLLIDDGSTNESTAIAKRFATAHPDKIFYLEHEGHANKGVCASRNLGVAKARGELIALLDADDVWLPEKLSHQVSLFRRYPEVGMVAEGSVQWFSWNGPAVEDVVVPVGAPQDKVYEPNQLLYRLYPLNNGAAPGPCALMLRKEAIRRIGGFEEAFVKQYQLYEDQAFLCKVYLHEKVYISSACNNLYRQRPGSVMQWVNNKGYYHTVRRYFLEWFQVYLKKNGIKDKRLLWLLRKALLPYHYPFVYYLTHTAPRAAWRKFKTLVPERVKRLIKEKFLHKYPTAHA